MPAVKPRSLARSRAVSVIVAGALASAGLAAAAPAASATTGTHFSIEPSMSVASGTNARIWGRLDNGSATLEGRSVALYYRANGTDSWHYAHAYTTGYHGIANAYWRVTGTRQFQYRYAGSGTEGPSVSPVMTITGASLGQRAVQEAARHNGAPYQYGATGPTRFDCSGFTLYVYERLGRSLPRTASAQYGATHHLSQSAKAVGDLIFFHNGSGIYHVGIYAGNNQMWAATHTGDYVRKESIYSSSYYVGRV